MNKWILVILFNATCILILAEVGSRYVVGSESLMYNIFGNTSSMWLTIWQNKAENQPDFYSTKYTYHTNYGWVLKSNLQNFDAGDGALYSTNTQSIRSNHDYASLPDSNVFRVVLIGDSYTEGAEVSNEETWGDYLQEASKGRIQVLNLGVGGFGHDQCLIRLQSEVLQYNPDLVLLGFVNCDIERNAVAFRDYAKPMFELRNEQLILKDSLAHQPEYYRKDYFLKSQAILHLMLNNEVWEGWEYQEQLSSAIIKEMAIFCENNEVEFYPVFIPTPNELYDASYADADIAEFFNEMCASNDLKGIDLSSIFYNAKLEGALQKKLGHWDAMGNQIIGESVYPFIETHFLK